MLPTARGLETDSSSVQARVTAPADTLAAAGRLTQLPCVLTLTHGNRDNKCRLFSTAKFVLTLLYSSGSLIYSKYPPTGE